MASSSSQRANDLAPAASVLPSDPPRLVYMLDGDFYVAQEDGTDPVRIVDGDADAECGGLRGNRGSMSRDGRRIAYRCVSNGDCPLTVFIADLEGRLVTSVPGDGWDIAWTPDGTRFATWLTVLQSIGVYGMRILTATNRRGRVQRPPPRGPRDDRRGAPCLKPRWPLDHL